MYAFRVTCKWNSLLYSKSESICSKRGLLDVIIARALIPIWNSRSNAASAIFWKNSGRTFAFSGESLWCASGRVNDLLVLSLTVFSSSLIFGLLAKVSCSFDFGGLCFGIGFSWSCEVLGLVYPGCDTGNCSFWSPPLKISSAPVCWVGSNAAIISEYHCFRVLTISYKCFDSLIEPSFCPIAV